MTRPPALSPLPLESSPCLARPPAPVRTAVAALLLTLVPAAVVTASPAQAANVGDAGQLHRLRLRPVPGADPEGDGRLVQELAVPGRRHLHLRRLARLPFAAQPHPGLGLDPAPPRLAAAADHPRAAGVVQPALPALRQRRDDQAAARERPASTARAQAGDAEAGKAVAAARALGIVKRSTLWYDLEGFDHTNLHCRESALAFLSAWTTPPPRARLRLRRLLERRVRHQDARRRTREPARRLPAARPDLARPLGPEGQHQLVLHPRRTAGAPAAG